MALSVWPAPSAEETAVRNATLAFVEKHVAPTTDSDDAEGLFRREIFDRLGPLGLHSLTYPKEWGGKEGSYYAYYGFLEELGRGSLALSVAVGVTNLLQGALMAFGTQEQKEKFLRPLTAGKYLGAFSLSEPQSGSDAAALRLAATPAPGGYVLNGAKCWCSNAGFADLYLVIART
ncbi:acyl-CoA dehydrogenase family protein, partial [bacterium]|nr:acyl-CoA dehydrogenase family protein [bacterium]